MPQKKVAATLRPLRQFTMNVVDKDEVELLLFCVSNSNYSGFCTEEAEGDLTACELLCSFENNG